MVTQKVSDHRSREGVRRQKSTNFVTLYHRVPQAMSHQVLYRGPIEFNKIQNFVKYGQVDSLLKANSMVSIKIGVKEVMISSKTICSSSNKTPFRQILHNCSNCALFIVPHFAFKANFACESP